MFTAYSLSGFATMPLSTMASTSLHSPRHATTWISDTPGSSRTVCVMSSIGDAFTISRLQWRSNSGRLATTSGVQSCKAYVRLFFASRRAGSMNMTSYSRPDVSNISMQSPGMYTVALFRPRTLQLCCNAALTAGLSSCISMRAALPAMVMASMPSPAVKSATTAPHGTSSA